MGSSSIHIHRKIRIKSNTHNSYHIVGITVVKYNSSVIVFAKQSIFVQRHVKKIWTLFFETSMLLATYILEPITTCQGLAQPAGLPCFVYNFSKVRSRRPDHFSSSVYINYDFLLSHFSFFFYWISAQNAANNVSLTSSMYILPFKSFESLPQLVFYTNFHSYLPLPTSYRVTKDRACDIGHGLSR